MKSVQTASADYTSGSSLFLASIFRTNAHLMHFFSLKRNSIPPLIRKEYYSPGICMMRFVGEKEKGRFSTRLFFC